nr:hypothetical protein Iba_chr10aCG4530 [Ipomoea batatas]GMD44854.1 hypothetical protein Iba_chr10dCG4470 [Ipomoea batatas]
MAFPCLQCLFLRQLAQQLGVHYYLGHNCVKMQSLCQAISWFSSS